jgi:hypothetical protein
MRQLVFQAIINDSVMNSLGITDGSSFSVDVDTPETRPFLQLRWGRNNEGLDVVTRRDLVVWVHDHPGDYEKIDSIVLRLRALLPSLVPSSDGRGWIAGVQWLGDSEDLTDDGHRTIARNSSFVLVGSGQ